MLHRRRFPIKHAIVPEYIHQHLADGIVRWPEPAKVCQRFLGVVHVEHSAPDPSDKGGRDLEERRFLLSMFDRRRVLLGVCASA